MIQDIEADYDNYDAFIIIHGTHASLIKRLMPSSLLTFAKRHRHDGLYCLRTLNDDRKS
jgi:hypothetical protein